MSAETETEEFQEAEVKLPKWEKRFAELSLDVPKNSAELLKLENEINEYSYNFPVDDVDKTFEFFKVYFDKSQEIVKKIKKLLNAQSN